MPELFRIIESILVENSIRRETKLIIGVSGGPDSITLLHLLRQYSSPDALVVGHLDHQLRSSSDTDRKFVEKTARKWDMPCYVRQVDVNELAEKNRWTIEEAGRIARYDFMSSLAAKVSAEYVVVGHNADDQVETVLMHLLRGSGLSGLSGMGVMGTVPHNPQIKLFRPLLDISRERIDHYCRENKLESLTDETNLDPAYLRNKLRLELIPYLESINPNVRTNIQQLTQLVAVDEQYLSQITGESLKGILLKQEREKIVLEKDGFQQLPLSLQRRVLRMVVEILRPSLSDLSFRAINQAQQVAYKGDPGAISSLPEGLYLVNDYQSIYITSDPAIHAGTWPQLLNPEPQILPIPGVVNLTNGWRISAEINTKQLPEIKSNPDSWQAFVEINEGSALFVRGRKPGEKLRPLGLKGSSASIQDIMVDSKIPANTRDSWPLVANAEHVIWVAGNKVDDRVKVQEFSAQVIRLKCWLESSEKG